MLGSAPPEARNSQKNPFFRAIKRGLGGVKKVNNSLGRFAQ